METEKRPKQQQTPVTYHTEPCRTCSYFELMNVLLCVVRVTTCSCMCLFPAKQSHHVGYFNQPLYFNQPENCFCFLGITKKKP